MLRTQHPDQRRPYLLLLASSLSSIAYRTDAVLQTLFAKHNATFLTIPAAQSHDAQRSFAFGIISTRRWRVEAAAPSGSLARKREDPLCRVGTSFRMRTVRVAMFLVEIRLAKQLVTAHFSQT
jgi:hypothetical protein